MLVKLVIIWVLIGNHSIVSMVVRAVSKLPADTKYFGNLSQKYWLLIIWIIDMYLERHMIEGYNLWLQGFNSILQVEALLAVLSEGK